MDNALVTIDAMAYLDVATPSLSGLRHGRCISTPCMHIVELGVLLCIAISQGPKRGSKKSCS